MIQKVCLFTPGPLNTSQQVKEAMEIDVGSRTAILTDLTQNIRSELELIAGGELDYTSILLQGSGTFAVEAMLSSLIQASDCVLIVSNGVYGDRLVKICQIHRLSYFVLQQHPTEPIHMKAVETFLAKESRITHIAVVQFETAIGILNDIEALLVLAQKYSCEVLVDAMSSFGAVSLPYQNSALTAVVSSSNKCLHGVPGIGFVIVRLAKLLHSSRARTLSLDLKEQWQAFEHGRQWRFTPPTHCLLALQQALLEFNRAGGEVARFNKYRLLNKQLVTALAEIDIYPAIRAEYRAPMITTFLINNKSIDFDELYTFLFNQGLVIYPSSFLVAKSFRVGCMGEIDATDIDRLVVAINKAIQHYEK
jgi:2-aminoethylphosphonate-pyruvate transaminase